MTYLLVQADARRIPLADKSVQMVCTSPPYWGLRDYGVDGQIGLEATPEAYVASMVAVFREVHRVLRDDGCAFVNLGDSYAGGGGISQPHRNSHGGFSGSDNKRTQDYALAGGGFERPATPGLKPKDLVGIPWRVAFALQADGWYLRSDCIEQVELYCPCGCGHVMEERIWRYSQDRDIIWSKPNPMPESVTDRPTKSHEYIFLLTKSPTYFWDAEAVREDAVKGAGGSTNENKRDRSNGNSNGMGASTLGSIEQAAGRNIRSVWTITPRPFAGAHFATFPAELVERCVKAGTSERGACPACGKCWERCTERKTLGIAYTDHTEDLTKGMSAYAPQSRKMNGRNLSRFRAENPATSSFRQACTCPPAAPVPCRVADPFGGAGTVPLVATNLGRVGIAIELSADYCRMAARRIARPHCPVVKAGRVEHHPLFAPEGA